MALPKTHIGTTVWKGCCRQNLCDDGNHFFSCCIQLRNLILLGQNVEVFESNTSVFAGIKLSWKDFYNTQSFLT